MSGDGLSPARLARLHEVLAGHVQRGEVAGVATVTCRHGHTRIDTIGCQDLARGDPMRRDTLFRIASMSKPITAVAAMILVEEGVITLDEPLDRLLPELAGRRVLRRIDSPLTDTEPARRALTLRDLLTFRLGIGLLIGPPERYPIQRAMNELQLIGRKPPTPCAPDEWIRRLGTLPLMYQPGERWIYHVGSEILGVLIARASGLPLESFLRQRLFEPLGMRDTGFHVPLGQLGRLASCYQPTGPGGALELFDDARDSQWSRPPAFPNGGNGLVSTLDDYLAFGRMLLGHGQLGGTRILSRPGVATMLIDYLTAEQKDGTGFTPSFWDNRGWGFGLAIVTRRDSLFTTPGRFGWNGVYGTSWACDPHEDLVAILMIQRLSYDPVARINQDFWTLLDQAIDD
ncbi:MAG: serine hydrolase domain-containing protein [Steroidobacteraceae bacterium]